MATAALDIIAKGSEDDGPVYVVVDEGTKKVLGTFWNSTDDSSDYGFESSIIPDFKWSPDRRYVAVTAGDARSRTVSLYRATAKSLQPVSIPSLSDDQAAPLNAVADPVADGMEAIRWQPNGTLLLKFWSQPRMTDDREPETATVWADLEVDGNQARIVGTSLLEPMEAVPDEEFDLAAYSGTHPVTGMNPSGSTYKGEVTIRVVDGVVNMEWKTSGQISRGRGVLVGMTLGVALDNGLAIYRIFGQSEGISLIGFWATSGSTTPGREAIRIGNADMTEATFAPKNLNGTYTFLREVSHGQLEGTVVISGGEIAKSISWQTGNAKPLKGQGLAVDDALAILTPAGLSVLENPGESLEGMFLTKDGTLQPESLIRQ